MRSSTATGPSIPRRDFLFLAASAGAALAAARTGITVPQELHLLKQGDIERLRLDFNSYRDKVRILTILSPT